MPFTYFTIYHPEAAETVLDELIPGSSPADAIQQEGHIEVFANKLANWVGGIQAGTKNAQIRVLMFDGSDNSPAAAQVDFDNALLNNGDTITIAGVVFTCVLVAPGTNEFAKGADSAASAESLGNAINASTSFGNLVLGSNIGDSLIVYCAINGPIGQLVSVVSDTTGMDVVSGPHLITVPSGFDATTLPKVYSFGVSNT